MATCLLERLRGLLERTYRMRTELVDLAPFVIGDQGFRAIYGEANCTEQPGSAGATGARTLVRETGDGLRACIYYPDGMIRRLERYPPHRGLSDENVDAFADLVEELDHLLLIAERSALRREVTLFELELHANVSKHLVLSRFLAGLDGRVGEPRRRWLRHHLFDKRNYDGADPAVRERYRDAARWAVRFIERLPALEPAGRINALRGFHAAPAQEKLRWIRSVVPERLGV